MAGALCVVTAGAGCVAEAVTAAATDIATNYGEQWVANEAVSNGICT